MDIQDLPGLQATSMMQRKLPQGRPKVRSRNTTWGYVPVATDHPDGIDPITRLLAYRLPPGKAVEIDYNLAGSRSEDPVYLTLYVDQLPVLCFSCEPPYHRAVELAVADFYSSVTPGQPRPEPLRYSAPGV